MSKTIKRELLLPQPREQVWQAITDSATLAEWMFPNNFLPRVGHRFTFQVPPNPAVKFDGLTVHCEVLACEPPTRLLFTWSAGGAVNNTQVSFQLEPHAQGTRLLLEHSGFELSHAFGEQAFKGAEYGWAKMLKQLADIAPTLRPAATIPDGSNFFSQLNTALSQEQVAALYARAGWRVRKCSWTGYEIMSDWAELVIEGGPPVLMHGPVASLLSRAEELVAPLRAEGISFSAECYADDPEQTLLLELKG